MNTDQHLLASSVPRSLDTKTKIFGLELADVILLLLNLSIQNLVFGSTSFKIPMVMGTTLALALVLLVLKRGKPDHYLQHFAEHSLSPSVKFANATDEEYYPFAKAVPHEE